jgi:hypothetical protein
VAAARLLPRSNKRAPCALIPHYLSGSKINLLRAKAKEFRGSFSGMLYSAAPFTVPASGSTRRERITAASAAGIET